MFNRKVVVVGSSIMDLAVKVQRRPNKGETIVGESFCMYIGGKGTNQAIAAARLGSIVHMVGCIGCDSFGDLFLENFKRDKINTDFVIRDPVIGTGIGTPVIDANGDNSIIIVPQANMMLSPKNVETAAEVIANADILMLQLEVPLDTSQRAAEIAKTNGTIVILNPAPACEIPESLFRLVDILIPNQTEAELLSGISINDDDSVKRVAEVLLSKEITVLIITLGELGAILFKDNKTTLIPPRVVDVVDTTGAGDAYCGALAASLAEGKKIEDAVYFASAAGALAVTKMGAEPSMPTRQDMEVFID